LSGSWVFSNRKGNNSGWVSTARCSRCGMTFIGGGLNLKEAKKERRTKMKNHKCPNNNRTRQTGK